jgi:hypothetical protein
MQRAVKLNALWVLTLLLKTSLALGDPHFREDDEGK